MRVTLKPFGPVDAPVLEHLRHELGIFGNVEVAPVAPIPPHAYDSKRRQYRAASFLEACYDEPGDRVLAITAEDLYAENLNFVFGYASIRDRYAVISTARLHDAKASRYLERALKEAVHEIGHTLGLEHDPDSACVMHFSNSLADTDRKGIAFCHRCRDTVTLTLKHLGK